MGEGVKGGRGGGEGGEGVRSEANIALFFFYMHFKYTLDQQLYECKYKPTTLLCN